MATSGGINGVNNSLIFALLGLLVISPTLRAELLERVIRETYPVPSEMVVFKSARGLIEVSNGPAGSAVELEVTLRVQQDKPTSGVEASLTRAAANVSAVEIERIFERMSPRAKVDVRRVNVTIADVRQLVFDWDPSLQVTIEARLKIPAGTALRVNNVEAALILPNRYVGDVESRSESGSLMAGVIEGSLIARTYSGSITVREVTGSSDLRSDSGLVLAGKLRGAANLRTSTGTVELQQAFDSLKVRGDDAGIFVGLSAPLPKSVDLATSMGEITLNMDRDLALTVDAATGLLGKVRVRGLSPAVRRGQPDGASMLADFSGGGLVVKMRGNGATVRVVGRDALGL